MAEQLENSAVPINPADAGAVADRQAARLGYRKVMEATDGTTPTSGGIFSPGGVLRAQSRRQGASRFAHAPLDPDEKARLTATHDLLTRGQREPGLGWDIVGYGVGHAPGAAIAHFGRKGLPGFRRAVRRGVANLGDVTSQVPVAGQAAVTGAAGAAAGQATP